MKMSKYSPSYYAVKRSQAEARFLNDPDNAGYLAQFKERQALSVEEREKSSSNSYRQWCLDNEIESPIAVAMFGRDSSILHKYFTPFEKFVRSNPEAGSVEEIRGNVLAAFRLTMGKLSDQTMNSLYEAEFQSSQEKEVEAWITERSKEYMAGVSLDYSEAIMLEIKQAAIRSELEV